MYLHWAAVGKLIGLVFLIVGPTDPRALCLWIAQGTLTS